MTGETDPAHEAGTVRVNRAPVLTLWASVVAGRLGHPAETALTLGRYVAGSSARAKAKRLGLAEDSHAHDGHEAHADHKHGAGTGGPEPRHKTIHLLGRDIPVMERKGVMFAQDEDKPVSAASVKSYVARAFGEDLALVRAAMETLAASMDKDELNRVGFRLYEHFRPEVPEGVKGWGAKGELTLKRIRDAARN